MNTGYSGFPQLFSIVLTNQVIDYTEAKVAKIRAGTWFGLGIIRMSAFTEWSKVVAWS
jgi:hypothetical protein